MSNEQDGINDEEDASLIENKPLIHKSDTSSSDHEIRIYTDSPSIQEKDQQLIEPNLEKEEIITVEDPLILEHDKQTRDFRLDLHRKLRPVFGEFPKESRGIKPSKDVPAAPKKAYIETNQKYCKGRKRTKICLYFVKATNGCAITLDVFLTITFWVLYFVNNPDDAYYVKMLISFFFGLNVLLAIFGFLTNVVYFAGHCCFLPCLFIAPILRICSYPLGTGGALYGSIGLFFTVPAFSLSVVISVVECMVCCGDGVWLTRWFCNSKTGEFVWYIVSFSWVKQVLFPDGLENENNLKIFGLDLGIGDPCKRKQSEKVMELEEKNKDLEKELVDWKRKHYELEDKRMHLEALQNAIKKIENDRKKKKRKADLKDGEYLYSEELRILREMGFRKDPTMKKLLDKHQGDLNLVVQEFL